LFFSFVFMRFSPAFPTQHQKGWRSGEEIFSGRRIKDACELEVKLAKRVREDPIATKALQFSMSPAIAHRSATAVPAGRHFPS
jgi:hypothetical protein